MTYTSNNTSFQRNNGRNGPKPVPKRLLCNRARWTRKFKAMRRARIDMYLGVDTSLSELGGILEDLVSEDVHVPSVDVQRR